jgi:hypothetical protein
MRSRTLSLAFFILRSYNDLELFHIVEVNILTVSKDMIIEDVLKKVPGAVKVFVDNGVPCVG